MNSKFADIHCHTTTKPFYTQKGRVKLNPFKTEPNTINSTILNWFRNVIERVSEIKLGSQSNFDSLFEGGHRIVVVSLTPPEKAFFILNQAPEKFITVNLKAFAEYTKVPYEGTIKNQVINALTGFSNEDIENCKRTGLDYYHDLLKKEYEFLASFNNVKAQKGYRVKLVKNYQQINSYLNEDPNTLCVLIGVEGAHSLGKSYGYGDLLRSQGHSHKHDPNVFGQTVTSTRDYVLNIQDMKQWEYPPLFISLYHHLWNELGGHARSLNRMMTVLINQEEGINLGLTVTGELVIKELLSNKNGKRILLDIKHMSPRSRRDYYKLLKEDPKLVNERIPIICSHTGVVSKRTTIDQMIDLSDNDDWKELNEEFGENNYLHECSINLCAEDVNNIFKSGGLIGIQLDEKRITGKRVIKIIKELKDHSPEDLAAQYAKVLLANIFRIVQVINKKEAWDIICIGSDFDGLINHLDSCPTSKYVPQLKSKALDVLESKVNISQPGFNYGLTTGEINNLLFNYTIQEVLDKVFYGNVENFLKKNFI